MPTSTAREPKPDWLNLRVIPPPAPFTPEVCLGWIREECAPLIDACRWGFEHAGETSETRTAFVFVLDDVGYILQAAADVVSGMKPGRPVRLDVEKLDWSIWTLALTRTVCAGLYNRPRHSDAEPPYGFNALAEILEARIAVEKLEGSERMKAAKAIAYPMAVEAAGGEGM